MNLFDSNNTKPGSFIDLLNKNLNEKTAGQAIFDTANLIIQAYIVYYVIVFILIIFMCGGLALIFHYGDESKAEYTRKMAA